MRKNKMANGLDEMNDPISEGREVNVINKQIPVKVGAGSVVFEVILWVLGIIPGLIFLLMKVRAGSYLRQLEQKLQHDASQIDNYLEQRVIILQNCAKLLDKAIDLDKETFSNIAKLRSGNTSDAARNEVSSQLESVSNKINVAFEAYPDLKAHQEIADAMQQNNYLQREITAAREVYNDTVNRWNQDIQAWPTKMIVAARAGYTTRIPFSTTQEMKQKAKEVLF
jgi:LemA protein